MSEFNARFMDKMKKMFESDKNADIEVHADGKVFKVLKSMLIAHSPVFYSMFEHDTKEKQIKIIKMEGYNYEIVKKFLLYFYIGQVENLNDIADEMFSLADYYQVDDLRQMTLEKMYENLTVENVFDRFEMAKKFQLNELEQKAIEFMKPNITTETMFEFYEFSTKHGSVELTNKIMCFIKNNIESATKSSEWEKFDDKFKATVLQSFVQQLMSTENEGLVKEELFLTIEKVADLPSIQQNFNGRTTTHHVRSFTLKNTGKRRVAFRIALNISGTQSFIPEPQHGFIDAGKECAIKITTNRYYVKPVVLYQSTDKRNIKECFKPNSFVRQISFQCVHVSDSDSDED